MSIQQVVQSRPSSNAGSSLNGKVGTFFGPPRDRFVYMATCLIGHPVEVQATDGSIYSGIFHATNVDQEFGVILKMARLIKEGPFKVQKLATESVGKGRLAKIMVIPAKDLVQVIAKDVAVTKDEMINSVQHEKCQDACEELLQDEINFDAMQQWIEDLLTSADDQNL